MANLRSARLWILSNSFCSFSNSSSERLSRFTSCVRAALTSADQLIQLQVHGFGVAILRVLDQEHHQKGDDRRAGVDDQLPLVGVAEDGTRYGPDRHDGDTTDEGPWRAYQFRGTVRELPE